MGRPSLRSPRLWLLLAVSGGGLALFFSRQDLGAMRDAFAAANLTLVLAAAGAYLAAHVVRAARWRYLLAHLTDCGY